MLTEHSETLILNSARQSERRGWTVLAGDRDWVDVAEDLGLLL